MLKGFDPSWVATDCISGGIPVGTPVIVPKFGTKVGAFKFRSIFACFSFFCLPSFLFLSFFLPSLPPFLAPEAVSGLSFVAVAPAPSSGFFFSLLGRCYFASSGTAGAEGFCYLAGSVFIFNIAVYIF
jgi:hypothetical protein